MKGGSEMGDKDGSTEQIGAILDSVTEKVPKLVSSLISTIFSAEAGKNIGAAVGSLYKELLAAGIPKEEAADMAKHYLDSNMNMMRNLDMKGK
jgi:hypothetical protein